MAVVVSIIAKDTRECSAIAPLYGEHVNLAGPTGMETFLLLVPNMLAKRLKEIIGSEKNKTS